MTRESLLVQMFKNIFLNDYLFAVPVAMDAAGALVGAATTAIIQHSTSGSVSGSGVIMGAGLGAAHASTGIVGKVYGWLKSLF